MRPAHQVIADFVGGPYDGQRIPLPVAFTQLVLSSPQPPGPNVRYCLVVTEHRERDDGSPPRDTPPPRYTYAGIEPITPPTPLPERPF